MGLGSRPPRVWRLSRSGRERLLLGLILAVGAALRLYGLNWDGGHWLQPDERQIYFVVLDLRWPGSLAEALSPDSPLNPRFFAYGSLPFYLLKLITVLLSPLWPGADYADTLHLIGRPLATLFDLGTLYLTYRLGRQLGIAGSISKGTGDFSALLAAALVGLAVFPVQLAHFYTVDPLLTFTVMLTLSLAADVARGGGWRRRVALGVALGLALATKVSAAPLILVVYVAHSTHTAHHVSGPKQVFVTVKHLTLTLAVAGLIFFLAQPYALLDWQTFLDHTIREAQIAQGTLDVPYTLQYEDTLPFLYSIWQTALWGLGLPLGLAGWAALAFASIRWLRHGSWADALLLAWAGPTLLIVGLFRTRHLRYMLPLVPILCLLAAQLLAYLRASTIAQPLRPDNKPGGSPGSPQGAATIRRGSWIIGYWILAISSLAYAAAFVRIYAFPHSWVSASAWIYREMPAGSTLAVEHWDTALPLPLELEGVPRRADQYDLRTLPLYDEPDGVAKWQALAADLTETDYLIIASRRLYGSISRVPERYPVASRYYALLFSGGLGFRQVGEFSRGPAWLNPRLPPLPDPAPALLRPDESFVVYDHPRALIFRNVERLPVEELLRRLGVY